MLYHCFLPADTLPLGEGAVCEQSCVQPLGMRVTQHCFYLCTSQTGTWLSWHCIPPAVWLQLRQFLFPFLPSSGTWLCSCNKWALPGGAVLLCCTRITGTLLLSFRLENFVSLIQNNSWINTALFGISYPHPCLGLKEQTHFLSSFSEFHRVSREHLYELQHRLHLPWPLSCCTGTTVLSKRRTIIWLQMAMSCFQER